jgi:hypothetical protein
MGGRSQDDDWTSLGGGEVGERKPKNYDCAWFK